MPVLFNVPEVTLMEIQSSSRFLRSNEKYHLPYIQIKKLASSFDDLQCPTMLSKLQRMKLMLLRATMRELDGSLTDLDQDWCWHGRRCGLR